MENKKIITGIALFAVLFALPLVAADSYELYCLGEGEFLNLPILCNPAMEPRTGPINICMHNLDNGKICPTNLNTCNSLGLSCSGTGNDTELDITPPTLIINSPIQDEVYTERGILLNVDPSEISSIDYQYKDDPRRWTQVCNSCSSYSRERGFKEGLNELTFRVKDAADNTAYFDLSFYVDSKNPTIKSTEPSQGFASGDFTIQFDEDNPLTLTINYGNSNVGIRTHSINLDSECSLVGSTHECSTNVNLADYDGQQIDYYVILEDIAGNIAQSQPEFLDVDNSDPIIESAEFTKEGKSITFNIEITEPYLKGVYYFENVGNNPKEKTLCSVLNGNVCSKKVSFPDGDHEVEIIVRDEAGNEATTSLSFFIDSAKPEIISISPQGDFASGLFGVEFEEELPQQVLLDYGNLESSMKSKILDLTSECIHQGSDYFCLADVSLSDYEGEEIEYKFSVTDIGGQTAEDGRDGLKVDNSYPVIQTLDFEVNGKSVVFNIEILESNLKEITYLDDSDTNPKEKKLCTKLNGNLCQKKVTFSHDGDHDVTITVKDLSGFSTAQSVQFFTDSKKPKIKSTEPSRRDFASGLFEVEFQEENPTSLVLNYGNDVTGMRTSNLDLASCIEVKSKTMSCSTELDVSDFDGEEISYEFTLTDRVGQTTQGGEEGLKVDTTFPEILNINYTLNGNKADVLIEVEEENLDEIIYFNENDTKPETKLCSKLDSNGMCKKTLNLVPGQNVIDFIVMDKAGNSVVESLTITI